MDHHPRRWLRSGTSSESSPERLRQSGITQSDGDDSALAPCAHREAAGGSGAASSASQTTIESFPEETHRAKPNTMSNEARTPLPPNPGLPRLLNPRKNNPRSGRSLEIENTLATQPCAPVLLQLDYLRGAIFHVLKGPTFEVSFPD
jgi:hypothetical protein